MHIDLPDDNSAELRDNEDLRRADIRAIYREADAQGINLLVRMGMDGVGAVQDALIMRFVRKWSLLDDEGYPLPITIATITDLRLTTYKPLAEALAPAMAEILSGGQPDPKSATSSSVSAPTD